MKIFIGTTLDKEGQKAWVTTLIKFRKAIKSWVTDRIFNKCFNTVFWCINTIDQTSANLNVTVHQCHQSSLWSIKVLQLGQCQCLVSWELQFTRVIQCFKNRLTEIKIYHESYTWTLNLNVINTRCYFSIVVYNKLLLWVSSGDQFISRNLKDAAIVSRQE